MSNALAIAAVTATLRNLLTQGLTLDPELADATVTAMPPDKARENGNTANQVNLFLYLTLPSAAWRNADPPRRSQPGDTGMPPLALNLFYLVTAYGRDNDTQHPFSHHLLGRAMSLLHDHSILGAEEIKAAVSNSDLENQLERVRFTLQPLSGEEIFRLWSSFQTQYRLSVAYEAAVVLIDSTRSVRTPLPVLTRGRDDSGITAQPSIIPPFPTIENVSISGNQPSAQLNDLVTLTGHDLQADQVRVVFQMQRSSNSISLDPENGRTAEQIAVRITNNPGLWMAGIYSVVIELKDQPGTPAERTRYSNQVAVAIAPTITSAFPIRAGITGDSATVKLKCQPQVRPEQKAALLLRDREITAASFTAPTEELTFTIGNAVAGEYLIRLRVDGVDSLLVDRSGPQPVFQDQKVVLA